MICSTHSKLDILYGQNIIIPAVRAEQFDLKKKHTFFSLNQAILQYNMYIYLYIRSDFIWSIHGYDVMDVIQPWMPSTIYLSFIKYHSSL